LKLTKDELKQIYYINKEIQMWQRELEKIRSQGLVKSPTISDMPKGGQKFDISDYVSAIADYEAVIRGLLAKVQIQRKKIIEYIEGVDDSLMKQIIFYRCVSCMTWQEVADAVGGNNTENSVKKAYSRFLAVH
jgi:hypothetical protein